MAPPVRDASAGTAPDTAAAAGLAGLLAERRRAYCRSFRHCRHRLDEEAVHDLRVDIRRLLAVLQLAKAAAPDAKVRKLRRHLRRRLKVLSRLRDLHVQLVLLATEARRAPRLRDFRARLEAEEAWLAERRARAFRRLRPGRERRRLARVERAVVACTATPRRARAAEAALHAAFTRAAARVAARHAAVDPARPETLHRLRVALKRQRYMAEALARLGLTSDAGLPSALREVQRRLGRIQDLDVLLRRVEEFGRESASAAPCMALAGRLRLRRDRLVRGFIASLPPADAAPPLPPGSSPRRRLRPSTQGQSANPDGGRRREQVARTRTFGGTAAQGGGGVEAGGGGSPGPKRCMNWASAGRVGDRARSSCSSRRAGSWTCLT